MLNANCHELRIVGNKTDYSDEQVRILAIHAAQVWDNAKFYEPTIDGLRQALADCSISAGTTRRMGQKRKSWGMTPEQFAAHVFSAQIHTKAAIVFGNERTGLTDAELECCTLAVNIPTSTHFPSLNLSHAVQIMTYTLFRFADTRARGYEPVTTERLERAMTGIAQSIERIGLYKNPGAENNARFLQGIFARAALSEGELKRLEKLFDRMSWVKKQSIPEE